MRKACLESVYELGKENQQVLFIGSDLGTGTMADFKQDMPARFFMEGIAEAHIIGMAAGLAMEGFIPYVNTIATFLSRRCYEQIAIDVCLHNLPVRLIGNGGGLVYAPLGPTHLAIEDIALMRALPNMTIIVPTDADEMKRMIPQSLNWPGPVYIRLAKGYDPIVSSDHDGFTIGKAIMMKQPGDVLIVACGVMVHRALKAAEMLADKGIHCGVMNMHTIKPLDQMQLLEWAGKVKLIVTIEEHTEIGGLGSAVTDCIVAQSASIPAMLRLALPDQFSQDYGSQDALLEQLNLQPNGIVKQVSDKYHRL